MQHSRADLFHLRWESDESATDTGEEVLEVDKKCEIKFSASKFLIGKLTGDRVKNNLRK